MKPTTLELIEDLHLLGYSELDDPIEAIKKSYLADIAKLTPKLRTAKPKTKEAFTRLEITEGGTVYEVVLKSDREVEAYLKKKQAERKTKIDLYLKAEGLYKPVWSYQEQKNGNYEKACSRYLARLNSAGFNFEVKITRC